MPNESFRYSLNAAFLAEIKEHNALFHVGKAKLNEFCSVDFPKEKFQSECGFFLHQLREAFSRQFDMEETYGYVSLRDPNTASLDVDRVTSCRAEHQMLMVFLQELSERFDGLQYQGTLERELEDFIGDLRAFRAKLMQHETTEQKLIQDFNAGSEETT